MTETDATNPGDSRPADAEAISTSAGREQLWGRAGLAIACLSAVSLCWPMLGDAPLALDEHVSYWIIDPQIPASVWERSQSYAATPPLQSWLQQVSLAAIGRSELALRLPFAVSFLAAVLVIYRVGREWSGPVTGGLAALMLAWHPVVLDEVRIGRGYGLVVLLTCLLLQQTLRWMQWGASGVRLGGWILIGALLVWTHYLAAFIVGLFGIGLLMPGRADQGGQTRLPGIAWTVLAGAGVGVLSAPLMPALYRMWLWSPALNGVARDVPWLSLIDSLWWIGFPVGWLVSRAVTRLTPPSSGASPGRPRGTAFLALLVIVPIIVLYAAGQTGLSSLATPRYRIGFAVPAVLLAAECLRRGATRLGATRGVAALLAAIWLQDGTSPWRAASLGNPMDAAWKEMAIVLGEELHGGDVLFVQSGLVEANLVPVYFEDPLFNSYVACSLGHFYLPLDDPRYALPWQWGRSEGVALATLKRLTLMPGQAAWLAAAVDTDLNQQSVEGFLALTRQAGLQASLEHSFAGAVLMRFERE